MNLHTRSLTTACEQLDLPFEVISNQALTRVTINTLPFYFIANRTPLNSQMFKRLVDDKDYTYQLLHQVVNMPTTKSYIDPNSYRIYKKFITHQSLTEIAQNVTDNFELPIIIKPNQGSMGRKIRVCHNKPKIQSALKEIFIKNRWYHHVVLAQSVIKIRQEFRVTVLNNQIVLIYQKDFSKAEFKNNISPLHAKGSKAIVITDQDLQTRIQKFINPIFKILPIEYAGLDIAIDDQNQMWLIEINANPRYNYLVRDNGQKILINLYIKMLNYLQAKK